LTKTTKTVKFFNITEIQDMSATNNILEMFNTIMQSNLSNDDKLTMIGTLSDLRNNVTAEAELAHDYEEETAPKETFKVTFKNEDETVFGHRRWATADRVEMFNIVKNTFGPHSGWNGRATPGINSGDFEIAMEEIGKHFGRTGLSIKSQIRDAVQPCADNKNEKSIRIGKQSAFDVGFITQDVLES